MTGQSVVLRMRSNFGTGNALCDLLLKGLFQDVNHKFVINGDIRYAEI